MARVNARGEEEGKGEGRDASLISATTHRHYGCRIVEDPVKNINVRRLAARILITFPRYTAL